jgi:arylsulfatase A-like enzyme
MKGRKQENILLIIIDCLRADFFYEPRKAHIPNLTKLRIEGYSFLNTIASTSTTTPSFASLLTCLYPFENGVRSHSGYSLKEDVLTFPQILKKRGFNTYAEVTGPLVKEIGLFKGFDEYNYRERLKTIHTQWGDDLINKFKRYYKEPWFILLHIWSLHFPRIVKENFNKKKYGKTPYARALSSIDDYLGKLFQNIDDNTLIILTGDHGEQIEYSKFDSFWKFRARKIFEILKKYKILDIHWTKGARRFFVGHSYSIYDKLVKVPLVFTKKGIVPVGESNCQIRHIDVFPTIMDLIGINYKAKVTGQSAMPIIEGKEMLHRDAFMEAVGILYPNKNEWLEGLRIDNKYIRAPFRQDFEDELYNLVCDPDERHNIANERKDDIEKYEEKINEMKTYKLVGEQISEKNQKVIIERLKDLGYID